MPCPPWPGGYFASFMCRRPGEPGRQAILSLGTPVARRSPGFRSSKLRLLELHLRAGLLELGLDLLGLVLRDTFLNGLRRAFDQVLGFLQAETRKRPDFLDDLDLLIAGGGED